MRNEQIYIQEILLSRLERGKIVNARFSLRSFARQLDLNPAVLSMILNGKRNVSLDMARKLGSKLCISPEEEEKLEEVFAERKESKDENSGNLNDDVQVERRKVTIDYYHIVSDWHYYAVLSLSELDDFQDNSEYIAKRLGISKAKARKCLDTLERAEMLVRDENGKLFNPGTVLGTSDDVVNLSIRKRHRENLIDAMDALETYDVDQREFSAMTMAIDIDKLPEAKRRIRRFKEELCEFLESENKNEVYEFTMQLFPRTKLIVEEEKR